MTKVAHDTNRLIRDGDEGKKRRRPIVRKKLLILIAVNLGNWRHFPRVTIAELSMHLYVLEIDARHSDNRTTEKISSGPFCGQLFKAHNISKSSVIVGQVNTYYY